MKSLATGVAAVAAIGAAAAGVTSIASITSATRHVQPVVFGAPLPVAPTADVPTTDQLITVLNGLQNPGIPFASKSYLVEGGVGGVANPRSMVSPRRFSSDSRSGSMPVRRRISADFP